MRVGISIKKAKKALENGNNKTALRYSKKSVNRIVDACDGFVEDEDWVYILENRYITDINSVMSEPKKEDV